MSGAHDCPCEPHPLVRAILTTLFVPIGCWVLWRQPDWYGAIIFIAFLVYGLDGYREWWRDRALPAREDR